MLFHKFFNIWRYINLQITHAIPGCCTVSAVRCSQVPAQSGRRYSCTRLAEKYVSAPFHQTTSLLSLHSRPPISAININKDHDVLKRNSMISLFQRYSRDEHDEWDIVTLICRLLVTYQLALSIPIGRVEREAAALKFAQNIFRLVPMMTITSV